MDIQFTESNNKGRYSIVLDGHAEEADMTFSRASAALVIVDHTGVPELMRGLGVGKALAERVVADARKHQFKIVPLCPFFKAQAARNPDWSDVVQ